MIAFVVEGGISGLLCFGLMLRNTNPNKFAHSPSFDAEPAIFFSILSYFKNFSKPLNPGPAHYKNLVISISYYINFFFPDFISGKINFFEQPTRPPSG
jgi:hypothetical protein